jgi:hypothetical protein
MYGLVEVIKIRHFSFKQPVKSPIDPGFGL